MWELLDGGKVVALTGAGLSTDSGIPDYRGPGAPARTPMTYADFSGSAANRRRYWARSHVGWSRMGGARPNGGHRALARLEDAGVVTAVVTQNVDGLHGEAGSRSVLDLHGRIDTVACLDCGERSCRAALEARLAALNPGWRDRPDEIETAPDGDALLEDVTDFRVADCGACGGRLKPDLVFFGENVPRERVERAYALVARARCLLVAGSSLTVFSGRRFVRRAYDLGIPVVIVNRGPTRGDAWATVRVDAGCSQTLGSLADRVGLPA